MGACRVHADDGGPRVPRPRPRHAFASPTPGVPSLLTRRAAGPRRPSGEDGNRGPRPWRLAALAPRGPARRSRGPRGGRPVVELRRQRDQRSDARRRPRTRVSTDAASTRRHAGLHRVRRDVLGGQTQPHRWIGLQSFRASRRPVVAATSTTRTDGSPSREGLPAVLRARRHVTRNGVIAPRRAAAPIVPDRIGPRAFADRRLGRYPGGFGIRVELAGAHRGGQAVMHEARARVRGG